MTIERLHRTPIVLAAACVLACNAHAQAGDRAGELQPDLPVELLIPATPPLSPQAEAATFVLPDGFRINLVASEPLIEAPVQAVFDEDGRLWVVEMRGYMPDVDGRGEKEPNGRISVLTDDDGDGRMDRVVVFLDGLVLPRAVAPTRGGALVIAPPQVLFCRDEDGDGRADSRVVVDTGIAGIVSPEYGPNGLLPGLDNWFQSACHDLRYRFQDGLWSKQRTKGGGQWGITKDDAGRILFNGNSDFLRGDLVPSQDYAGDARLDAGPLVNASIALDQTTFPGHKTPGLNRAYTKDWLRDGRLKRADAACGPHVYRGAAFPREYRGNVFVCEPGGNLVKCMVLEEKPPFGLAARNAWPDREFLTSTDERFRPVNLADGPDGALYVVDMYRGVLQHRNFVTTFLRKQILARELEKPIDRGRIWRVSRAKALREPAPQLSQLASADLVKLLDHPNGWVRDTAQRLFVEGDWERETVVPRVRAVATEAESPLARLHALWALDGMGAVDADVLAKALQDADVHVQLAALRLAAPFVAIGKGPPPALLLEAVVAGDARVMRQAIASLAGVLDPLAAARLVVGNAHDAENRRAFVASVRDNRVRALEAFLNVSASSDPAPDRPTAGRGDLLVALARAIVQDKRAIDLDRLVEGILGGQNHLLWQRLALVEGALAGRGKGPRGQPARIQLSREPQALVRLAATQDPTLSAKVQELLDALAWPGRADLPPEETIRPLTSDESARFERGRTVFATVCSACHQSSGLGEPGKAPPLASSEYVLGDPEELAKIVIGGLEGPVTVDGRVFDLAMPSWNGTDDEIASVSTYLRREWGHGADPVTFDHVARARESTRARGKPWTIGALKQRAPKPALPLLPGTSIALCNGRDLSGWRAIGDAQWSVEGDVIRGRTGGGSQSFLATERTFGDFTLEVDVKLQDKGNSGIQIRSHQNAQGRLFGYQIEIDPTERAWSGGLYDEARRGWLDDLTDNAAGRAAFRKDDWNRYRIKCDGTHIQAWVNDVATADWIDPADVEGFVALQVHSGQDTDVLWRAPQLVDRGLRSWEPLITAEEWRAATAKGGARLASRRTLADFALRVRGRGDGIVVFRGANETKRGTNPTTLAPGISVSENGWWLEIAHVERAEKTPAGAPFELCVTAIGPRVAIHVDNRLLLDVTRDERTSGDLVIASADGSTTAFDLDGVELLSEPRR